MPLSLSPISDNKSHSRVCVCVLCVTLKECERIVLKGWRASVCGLGGVDRVCDYMCVIEGKCSPSLLSSHTLSSSHTFSLSIAQLNEILQEINLSSSPTRNLHTHAHTHAYTHTRTYSMVQPNTRLMLDNPSQSNGLRLW